MSIQLTLKKIYELLETGDNSNAISYCTNALEIYHKDPDLLSARAEALLKSGRNREALKDFDLAAKIEPKNPFRFSSRAFLKEAIGDTNGALKDYNLALDLDPNDATIQNNLGLLEEKLGYQKNAKKRFEIADELYSLNTLEEKTTEDPSLENEIKNTTLKTNGNIISKVFSDRIYRKEFFQFLLNGFRLKK